MNHVAVKQNIFEHPPCAVFKTRASEVTRKLWISSFGSSRERISKNRKLLLFRNLFQPKILQPVHIVIIREKVYKIRKYRKNMYVSNKQTRRRNDVSGFEWISVARMYSGNSLLKVNLSKLTRFFKLVVCICHCHVFMSCFIPTFNFSSLL